MSKSVTSTNQYNKAAMGAYNAFQPQVQSSLQSMVSNPLGSSYFQNQLSQQQRQSDQVGQRNVRNVAQNMKTGGGVLSNAAGYTNTQLSRAGNANSLMQSNAFNSSLNSALSNRSSALANMQAYSPLQTGQTSSTGGVGTYLGPVLAAVGGAMGGKAGVGGAMTGAANAINGQQVQNTSTGSSGGGGGSTNSLSVAGSGGGGFGTGTNWWNNNNGGFPY